MCGALLGALTQSGISAGLGFLMSFVVELWPAWETKVPSRFKRLIMMVASILIGLGLYGLVVVLGCTEATQEGVWAALTAGFAAFLANQMAHLRTLAPTKQAEVEQAAAAIIASVETQPMAVELAAKEITAEVEQTPKK